MQVDYNSGKSLASNFEIYLKCFLIVGDEALNK